MKRISSLLLLLLFPDLSSHRQAAEFDLLITGGRIVDGAGNNFIRMGVTSVVTGNCGSSMTDLGQWFAELEKTGISLNVASLTGHNTVRHEGMNGDFDRAATPEELQTGVKAGKILRADSNVIR
ncbi:MAG: hypothetical protein J2P31_19665 [Blastocatellia bacterium]|nr:hypothetical protein [Blastocatellia bacterium]